MAAGESPVSGDYPWMLSTRPSVIAVGWTSTNVAGHIGDREGALDVNKATSAPYIGQKPRGK
jgi:hypothetical protein